MKARKATTATKKRRFEGDDGVLKATKATTTFQKGVGNDGVSKKRKRRRQGKDGVLDESSSKKFEKRAVEKKKKGVLNI